MNDLQITMAKLEERIEFHERRLTRNEDLTEKIHKLASSVESLTTEVKTQNERTEKFIIAFDDRMKTHGERIGELEKKGSKKLEHIVTTIVTVVITAIIMYFVSTQGAG